MDPDRAHYSPPWANTSIVGIAGSSGSGKTSLAVEIVSSLNLPWVVILSMDSFYKPLNAAQHAAAHKNEYDFDSPNAIDYDMLVERLRDLKAGRRADIPIYSFSEHQRQQGTTPIYSPHVLVLEGIFALYDQRVLDMMDLRLFAEADADVCLARRSESCAISLTISRADAKIKQVTRDVQERGRDIEGCIKQWLRWVKPNFERYVEPQRKVADIIIPRGTDNKVAIDMVIHHIQRTLKEKSKRHQDELRRLGEEAEDEPLSSNIILLPTTPQIKGMSTILQNPSTDEVDFVFYFDRLSSLLVGCALESLRFVPSTVTTPQGSTYDGLKAAGEVSAVVILRGGSCLETGLKRMIPDCKIGRLLVQTNYRTGEPELHYLKFSDDIATHDLVLLLDPQMSSGGAALMAVRVLVDHGVPEDRIVFVTMYAGKMGLNRLMKVFPALKVVMGGVVEDSLDRWVERRYFGC